METLLSSRVRAKLITAFFLAPGIEQNAWDLTQSLGETYSAVWKELNRLERMGILESEQRGNVKTYRVNTACPIESELRSIVMKTEGIGGVLRDKLGNMENVHRAFIFGSVASGKADRYSDIDLMIIGDIDLIKFSSIITDAERSLDRPINYLLFSAKEWKDKLDNEDPFAMNVENAEKIILVGGENGV